ncbi:ABC transporter ATP-binding protein [Halomonas daqingensis]|uniref:ABC transporter ATP-binding protein n=1 Tax=Billgrantia desiderata TaxID=52021 RepID=A0ABS9BA63_9GAMM|nr:ABC transporter ATP-binding protein [Halomonas desiderata]MCE8044407.1 ABC transporter ATP-binding protein [Halomonas desiderata]MCE8048981.1 ABC transporter ATP-binding protein [Halomonas desiderata]
MTETLLKAARLEAGYDTKPVLQGIDIEVKHGEIVAVIGRNGVGKSTLMKSLIGLLPCDQGELHLAGEAIAHLPAHRRARRGIGYVPQGREVFPRMTVIENLRTGESLGAPAPGVYERMFEFFPILKERRNQRAGTLSGGQQQQLAIARVLIGSPQLVLLDEPSEGIQPSIVQEIARIMVRLNRESGLTVVFVEQNIDMIRAMAHRCYVMDKGRIVTELSAEMLADRDTVRRYLSV